MRGQRSNTKDYREAAVHLEKHSLALRLSPTLTQHWDWEVDGGKGRQKGRGKGTVVHCGNGLGET